MNFVGTFPCSLSLPLLVHSQLILSIPLLRKYRPACKNSLLPAPALKTHATWSSSSLFFFLYLIHSFFHSFIYPFIYLMNTYGILLCAIHSARCCKWVSELDTDPADKENKDAPFLSKSESFAYTLYGFLFCILRNWALPILGLACVSTNKSSHSTTSFLL